jgi:hypothetical protein
VDTDGAFAFMGLYVSLSFRYLFSAKAA